VRSFEYLEFLAAEREHLGHERHAVELPTGVQRPQDLFLASDLHPLTGSQFSLLFCHGLRATCPVLLSISRMELAANNVLDDPAHGHRHSLM